MAQYLPHIITYMYNSYSC